MSGPTRTFGTRAPSGDDHVAATGSLEYSRQSLMKLASISRGTLRYPLVAVGIVDALRDSRDRERFDSTERPLGEIDDSVDVVLTFPTGEFVPGTFSITSSPVRSALGKISTAVERWNPSGFREEDTELNE